MTKTYQMQLLEIKKGEPIELFLKQQIEAGKTWGTIADEIGVSRVTMQNWRRRLGARVVTRRSLAFDPPAGAGQ